jgi:hypothetical protein
LENDRGRPNPSPDPLPKREGAPRRFTDCAARLAGLAGALLGWRPGEFWEATPAELATVLNASLGGEAQPASSLDLARLKEMFPDG